MNEKERLDKIRLLNQLFSPSAPIREQSLFFGRINEIESVAEGIYETGQHVVLFGDRGVGKTSLANIIQVVISDDVTSSKVTCSSNDDFKGLWKRALSKIDFIYDEKSIGYKAGPNLRPGQLDMFIPEKDEIDSNDLEKIFENLNTKLLFVFDEYDRIVESSVKARFAEVIKALSDNSANVSILLVGISRNVNELIGEHVSLERCLKQVPVPRMDTAELEKIIDNGFDKLKLQIGPNLKGQIIEYSSGFPHYTHLLGKYCALSTLNNNKVSADLKDFNFAIEKAIDNTQQQIRNDYQEATISSKKITFFEEVLFALANAKTDEFDCSSANDVLIEFNKRTSDKKTREGIIYYLNAMCKENRKSVVRKVGVTKNIKYTFQNSLMKSFVKMKDYTRQIV